MEGTVWVATLRRGLDAHRLVDAGTSTACGRCTARGELVGLVEARERYGVGWCARCWPGGGPEVAGLVAAALLAPDSPVLPEVAA